MSTYLRVILLTLCIACFKVDFLNAQQTIITGNVQDEKTKEPLFLATIRVIGRDGGVLTDIDGNFEIILEGKVDSFLCSYVGYEQQVFKIKEGKTNTFKIKLKNSLNELATATVEAKKGKLPKDTLAIQLWRNVVAHKDKNLTQLSANLQYKMYSKVEIDINQFNRFRKLRPFRKGYKFVLDYVIEDEYQNNLPFLMTERISDMYIQKDPKKQKQIVRLEQLSGIDNSSISSLVSSQTQDVDIYANTIIVAEKSIVAPFSAVGNLTYRYFLTDSTLIEGNKFYKLEFWGRTPEDLAFAGMAWIEDSTFAVHQINMQIPKSVNINFLSHFKVEQSYKRLEDGTLLKEKELAEAAITLFKPKKRDPFGLIVRKTSMASDIQMPESLHDTLFNTDKVLFSKGYFTANNNELWDTVRPEPLDEREAGIYTMIDSIKEQRSFKFWYGLFSTLTSSYVPLGYVRVGAVHELVSFNNVEGTRLKLGMKTSKLFSRQLNLSGYMAYGTKDEGLKGGLRASWRIPNKRNYWRNLSGGYTNDYTLPGTFARRKYDNILYSLLRERPIDKLMKMSSWDIAYSHEWLRGLTNTLTLSNKTYFADANAGFDFNNGQAIINKFSVNQIYLNTNWGPGQLFFANSTSDTRLSLGSKLPIFNFDYTFSQIQNFLGRDLYSHKIDIRMEHKLNWFMGQTRYNLHWSKTFGELAYPMMNIHLGNETYFYNRRSYNMMLDGEFVSDASFGILFEHYFQGFFLNKIPLLRKLKMREIIFYRGLWGSIRQSNLDILALPNTYFIPNNYQEVGFGVENILKFLRVDFIWRLTHLDQPLARPFGIKIGIYPKF